MRKVPAWIVMLVLIILILALLAVLCTTATAAENQHRLHLIAFAQDAETEVEVTVDGKKKTELMDAGVTYLSYKIKTPEVSVLAYGDKITPKVDKGRDGEYYAIVCISPPGESVGERHDKGK